MELHPEALAALDVFPSLLLSFLLLTLTLFGGLLVKSSRLQLLEDPFADELSLQHAHGLFQIVSNYDFDHFLMSSREK